MSLNFLFDLMIISSVSRLELVKLMAEQICHLKTLVVSV